jgi:predicted benzoate:H+ symporter BenE
VPLARDLSVSAVTAGFVTVLVGFASSAVIVFQAAGAVGATPAQVSSWLLALGLGMGLTCVLLSLRYRAPVVTAWSTPGAALLVTSAVGLSVEEATGAFLVSAALITLAGFSGRFAGLALFATIGNGLATAPRDENQREPALVTFLVTASGVTLSGVGSAFWGLVAGVVTLLILRAGSRRG